MFSHLKAGFPFFISIMVLYACNTNSPSYKQLEVTATAFNSVYWQTKSINPSVAAWGDTLKAGMKTIAVSRDLLDSGLSHNTKVFIEELNDTFLVKDKMNKRWRKKIDIYMGTDIQKARSFGKKKVTIKWQIEPKSSIN